MVGWDQGQQGAPHNHPGFQEDLGSGWAARGWRGGGGRLCWALRGDSPDALLQTRGPSAGAVLGKLVFSKMFQLILTLSVLKPPAR